MVIMHAAVAAITTPMLWELLLLVGYLTSQQFVSFIFLRDGSALTSVRAATLRQKLQIKLATSPSHSVLTQGRPVPALTL